MYVVIEVTDQFQYRDNRGRKADRAQVVLGATRKFSKAKEIAETDFWDLKRGQRIVIVSFDEDQNETLELTLEK